ncbi:MAG: hypothetical protein MZV63_47035 [Marinilabiliales bacterium]|nr:hypothetical protein [Marinilabiliales bacterium]
MFPGWLAALLLAGAVAAMISTAESMLLVAATSISEDVYKGIIKKGRAKRPNPAPDLAGGDRFGRDPGFGAGRDDQRPDLFHRQLRLGRHRLFLRSGRPLVLLLGPVRRSRRRDRPGSGPRLHDRLDDGRMGSHAHRPGLDVRDRHHPGRGGDAAFQEEGSPPSRPDPDGFSIAGACR